MAEDMAESKGGGLVKTLGVVLVTLLVAAGAGFAVYKFVLAPRLLAEAKHAATEEKSDSIPAEAVAFSLPEGQVAVQQSEGGTGQTILIYVVTLICANEQTKALVEAQKALFNAKMLDLHMNRTKAELRDPAIKATILKQALEESNSLLRRLQNKPNPAIKIVEVIHEKFLMSDM